MYHGEYIWVGLRIGQGACELRYPLCATISPVIYELNTTRVQLGRELDAHLPSNAILPILE